MIIDMHTHVFPDNLADRAMSALLSGSGNLYAPVHNGTVSGLLREMDGSGVDISVIQPVITKASQVKKTNEWVKSVCSDRIAGFGGIYPHAGNYKEDIDFVLGLGLKGLKFHAEYQDFVVDDIKMLRIYDYALGKGLAILHHAGFDPAFNPPFRSSPKGLAKAVNAMQGGVFIAAHLGGQEQWDDVEEHLVGANIYLDTSMGFEYFSGERFLRIVRNHGARKILFASDSPWSNAGKEIEKLTSLSLDENDLADILGGNAKRILSI